MRALLRLALIIAILLNIVPSAIALDVALPSDMLTYSIIDDWPDNSGYYMFGTTLPGANVKSYLLIMAPDGEIVYYKAPEESSTIGTFSYHPERDLFSYSLDGTDRPLRMVILDSDFTPIDSIPSAHPFEDGLMLDAHEILLPEDSTIWTLWRDFRTIDMSELIIGGDPEALVAGHVIQKWDSDGNLIWSWNSHDHTDALPYTARYDSSSLYLQAFDHVHINSMKLKPNGNVLVSTRSLSLAFEIDYDTGDVLWRLGGGPMNDFELLGDPGDTGLEFYAQHDARILPNGNITIYDNGNHHDPPQSAAKEYDLNFNNMTAELVYQYYHTEALVYGHITGSFERLDNGNNLICWGGQWPVRSATELDSDNNILWEMTLDSPGTGPVRPIMYRIQRLDQAPVAAKPYVSHVLHENAGVVELVCNWWGHEDEVAAYEVYWNTEWPPVFHGTTDNGTYAIEDYDPDQNYYARIRALNADGDVISGFSKYLFVGGTDSLKDQKYDTDIGTLTSFILSNAYPNPFNTTARFTIDVNQPGDLRVTVNDVLGRHVLTLYNGHMSTGIHPFVVGADKLSSGTFFIRAASESGQIQSQRITLVK